MYPKMVAMIRALLLLYVPFIMYGNSRALPLYTFSSLHFQAILIRVESKGHFTHETESP